MRYLTVRIDPSENGGLHPLGEALTAEPTITREAIHSVDARDDGTVVLFAEGSGDRERYEEIAATSPHVIDSLATGTDRWLAVSRFEPTDAVERLLTLPRESNLSVEYPIRIGDDGSLRVTVLGSDGGIRRLYRTAAAGDALSVDVLETGSYDPDEAELLGVLTDRQREVLTAAVEAGYYREPRAASLAEVARELDVTPSTAGEHLRKIEARVFAELVR
ncbi:helix-turn-helix domain-containing protein [Halovivax limisalsi]|uniref:helix-turn-helix domain-containing protein n=1 Tax=Halovivax limisalsi TaxID=1453760 RepID=UPI001FFD3827|nr:helix-turn-helix domain-containing protein [Halovivax limisalsi]